MKKSESGDELGCGEAAPTMADGCRAVDPAFCGYTTEEAEAEVTIKYQASKG